MDINRLHYFCTVVNAGSLVKASELLGVSQPALSKALKKLEDEIGHKLIVPSGRGIAITDNGRKLAAEAAPLIEKIDALKTIGSPREELLESLSIATFEVFSTYFLGKVLSEQFAEKSDVKILELVPGPMEEAIANRRADIGITYLPIPHSDLDIHKITTIEMAIYGNNNRFKKMDFSQLPFVAPNIPISGTPSKAKGLDGWPDHLIPRSITYRVTMMETALDLCRRGQCVGYFPKFVVELHNRVSKTDYNLEPLPGPPKVRLAAQEVFMIKRKSDLETASFKKIARAIRNLK
jgi:DNA-binding transcriptional LysR family regulator